MKFDPRQHGPGAREHAPPGYDGWTRADELNAAITDPAIGKWVPWSAVWERDGVLPRPVDRDTAQMYSGVMDQLPPIEVQAGTWCLLSGAHRLEAARLAHSDHIRIVEVDVPDDQLAAYAFLANTTHGRQYSLAERHAGLKVLLADPRYAEASERELARLTGLHRDTIHRVRNPQAPVMSQTGTIVPPVRHNTPKTPVVIPIPGDMPAREDLPWMKPPAAVPVEAEPQEPRPSPLERALAEAHTGEASPEPLSAVSAPPAAPQPTTVADIAAAIDVLSRLQFKVGVSGFVAHPQFARHEDALRVAIVGARLFVNGLHEHLYPEDAA